MRSVARTTPITRSLHSNCCCAASAARVLGGVWWPVISTARVVRVGHCADWVDHRSRFAQPVVTRHGAAPHTDDELTILPWTVARIRRHARAGTGTQRRRPFDCSYFPSPGILSGRPRPSRLFVSPAAGCEAGYAGRAVILVPANPSGRSSGCRSAVQTMSGVMSGPSRGSYAAANALDDVYPTSESRADVPFPPVGVSQRRSPAAGGVD